MRITNEYVFFWRDSIAQWHLHPIYDPVSKLTFNCAEQFMMYYKAMLFGDNDTATAIMCASHPRDQQALGRTVKNYNQGMWDNVKYQVVCNGNYLKFSQAPHLLKILLDNRKKQFVEASPKDLIWGIGMKEDDLGVEDPKNWKGENLLGRALTETADILYNSYQDNLYYIENVYLLNKI